MANRVIQFGRKSVANQQNSLSNEVYLDISTAAAPTQVQDIPEPILSDFYDYVVQEKDEGNLLEEQTANKLTFLTKQSYDEYLVQYAYWKRQFESVSKPIFEEYAKLLETEDKLSAVITENEAKTDRQQIALLTDNKYLVLYDAWLRYINLPRYRLQKLVNVNVIKNSIHNIFTWTPGERILNPEFGSNLRKLLYEGITDFNQEQIIAEIRHSISQWEPRVQIDNIVKLTTVEDREDNTVHLRIIYSIPSLSREQYYYDYDANAPQ